jgi:hypothetical protein
VHRPASAARHARQASRARRASARGSHLATSCAGGRSGRERAGACSRAACRFGARTRSVRAHAHTLRARAAGPQTTGRCRRAAVAALNPQLSLPTRRTGSLKPTRAVTARSVRPAHPHDALIDRVPVVGSCSARAAGDRPVPQPEPESPPGHAALARGQQGHCHIRCGQYYRAMLACADPQAGVEWRGGAPRSPFGPGAAQPPTDLARSEPGPGRAPSQVWVGR